MPKPTVLAGAAIDLDGEDLLRVGHVDSLAAVLPADVSATKPLTAASVFPIAANSMPGGPSRTIKDLDDLIRYLFGSAPAQNNDSYADDSYQVDTY